MTIGGWDKEPQQYELPVTALRNEKEDEGEM